MNNCWHPRRIALRGHSLIELVTAMVAASMLLAGLASTMYIGRQIAYLPTTSQQVIEHTNAIQDMAEELQYALYIVKRSANLIEFVVDDRTGDAIEETIRYEWSGTAGDPLLRTFNHGTPRTVVESVDTFQLEYAIQSTTESVATWDETAESVLWTQANASGSDIFSLTETEWISQHLTPLAESGTIPTDLVDWKLTKIQFEAQEEGIVDGQFAVQLRLAGTDGISTSPVVSSLLFNESTLSSSWVRYTATFSSPVAGLSPHDDYAIVYQWLAGTEAAQFRTNTSGGSGLLTSNDSGALWDCASGGEMSYAVFGTYRTPGTPVTFTRNRLGRIDIFLQAGGNAIGRMETSTQLANRPELLSAYWHAQFHTDPTNHDINGDGTADWTVRGGGAFDTDTLIDGVWQADATLDSLPLNAFAKITTVDVRMRNTSVGADGAVFSIHADWSGGLHAPLFTYLQLQNDGTQTLTLYGKTDNSTRSALCVVPNLPDRFLDVRLVILPDHDRVQLQIDDVDYGSFVYPTFAPSGDDRFASILPSGSNAEFDHVLIRVVE